MSQRPAGEEKSEPRPSGVGVGGRGGGGRLEGDERKMDVSAVWRPAHLSCESERERAGAGASPLMRPSAGRPLFTPRLPACLPARTLLRFMQQRSSSPPPTRRREGHVVITVLPTTTTSQHRCLRHYPLPPPPPSPPPPHRFKHPDGSCGSYSY